MKNVHILPTDKPSRLFKDDFGKLFYSINIDQEQNHFEPQHIYITSDEEIKRRDWFISNLNEILKCTKKEDKFVWYERLTVPGVSKIAQPFSIHINLNPKKIILTTDQDLIKDGVQAIDDEFLEWVVKNSSCEEVEVKKVCDEDWSDNAGAFEISYYKIIIPKEEQKQHLIDMMKGDEELGLYQEPKQEITLEEAAVQYSEGWGENDDTKSFIEGAKWQQERMYSEEEVENILIEYVKTKPTKPYRVISWFNQFKKKTQ